MNVDILIGVVIGLFVGVNLGVVIMAALQVNKGEQRTHQTGSTKGVTPT